MKDGLGEAVVARDIITVHAIQVDNRDTCPTDTTLPVFYYLFPSHVERWVR